MRIFILGALAVIGRVCTAEDASIRTSGGDIVLKVAEGKSVSFATGSEGPVSINDMDSVLAKLESTLLGRNSRGDGKVADDDQKGKGESVIDKLETLDKTTSEVATAVTNASGEAATLGQATQNIVSQLADNLVGADNGVLSELLELNKNLAKIPELIELQTASNELAKTQVTQGEKAAAVSSSATFASCVLDGKQVGCTLGGGKLAIAGHSFAANFPELYECVLSSDSLKKDLASLKTSATSSNMVICNLPSFGDVQLPSKEVNLDLTLSEGGVAVNAKPLKVRFVTEAPKINFKESSIQVSALEKTIEIPFTATDGDTNINTLKFTWSNKGCGAGIDDTKSFKVTGALGSNDRVLVLTPTDTKATADNVKCMITVTASDNHWSSSATFELVRLGIMESCADWGYAGATKEGKYRINMYNSLKSSMTVYCRFTPDGAAWTLVDSSAFSEKGRADKSYIGSQAYDFGGDTFKLYRMSRNNMNTLRDHSSRWLTATNNKMPQVDGLDIDHAQATFLSFDILDFKDGGICQFMESISIRATVGGAKCTQCYARWWQDGAGGGHLHTDSGGNGGCYNDYLKIGYDGVSSEDNFGHYGSPSKKFSGTRDGSSTTQYWFQDLPPKAYGGNPSNPATSCQGVKEDAKKNKRIPFDGRYYVTQNGAYSPRLVYCKMQNTALAPTPTDKAWTLFMSYQLRRTDRSADHTRDMSWSAGNPHNSKYRESKSFIAKMKDGGSQRWMVTCNTDMNEQKSDHARMLWKNLNIIGWKGGGSCRMHESYAVRNNRRNGARCKDCYGKWWQSTNGPLHSDSGNHHSSCGGNYWRGSYTVGSEDNFGGYWSRSNYHTCSNNAWSTTQWWSEY